MEEWILSVEHLDLIEFGPTLLMNLVTLLVLYLILKKIFFDKIHEVILNREQNIEDRFNNADHVKKQADELLITYKEQLEGIEAKSREIIKESKQRADTRAEEIVADAEHKVSDMIKQAEKDIEAGKLRAVDEMREQIAALAILAAEKILEKELDIKSHAALIDNVISQASNTQLKH
jgi:F-type H+-transporting ATPase subunit b